MKKTVVYTELHWHTEHILEQSHTPLALSEKKKTKKTKTFLDSSGKSSESSPIRLGNNTISLKDCCKNEHWQRIIPNGFKLHGGNDFFSRV